MFSQFVRHATHFLLACLQPKKPPDEERAFRHDAELKDLSTMDRKDEVYNCSLNQVIIQQLSISH